MISKSLNPNSNTKNDEMKDSEIHNSKVIQNALNSVSELQAIKSKASNNSSNQSPKSQNKMNSQSQASNTPQKNNGKVSQKEIQIVMKRLKEFENI